jgi:DNA-binding CsgD family transcriptional regulator
MQPEVRRRNVTPREREVAELTVTGLTNNEIGDLLGISGQTVKRHVANLMLKLNVFSRSQIAVAAISRGWASLPESTDDDEIAKD